MSVGSTKNRWVPYQCPLCFGLFRLKKEQIGSAGHCPTCQSVIRVPEETGEAEGLPIKSSTLGETPSEEQVEETTSVLLEKISEAKQMSEEELAEQEEAYQNRKRLYVGGVNQIDWEESVEEEKESGPSSFVLWGGVMCAFLMIAGGIFYVKNSEIAEKEGGKTVLGDVAAQAELDAILELDSESRYRDENGVDSAIESVDGHEEFDIAKIELVLREFLDSSTLSERVKWVRDPERVRPMMLRYYQGEELEPEGLNLINRSSVTFRRPFMIATVQTGQFLNYPITVERFEEEGEDYYKVDWESWVGYCDYRSEEMRRLKPTDPFLLRVLISKGNYYNYDFSDEKEWVCYQLEIKDSEYSFSAYARRGSIQNRELERKLRNDDIATYMIRVRFPEGARSQDQLEIVELVSTGWLIQNGE